MYFIVLCFFICTYCTIFDNKLSTNETNIYSADISRANQTMAETSENVLLYVVSNITLVFSWEVVP